MYSTVVRKMVLNVKNQKPVPPSPLRPPPSASSLYTFSINSLHLPEQQQFLQYCPHPTPPRMTSSSDSEAQEIKAEYASQLLSLGSHADKVQINALTMIAEDSSEYAESIYACIRTRLLHPSTRSGEKLPLIYLLDSILNNVRGSAYTSVISGDIHLVFHSVLTSVNDETKGKMRKVLGFWGERGIFDDRVVKKMEGYFKPKDEEPKQEGERAFDLSRVPEEEIETMRTLLREMQSEMGEVNPMSLEDLCAANPSLAEQICEAARSQTPNDVDWDSSGVTRSTAQDLVSSIEGSLASGIDDYASAVAAMAAVELLKSVLSLEPASAVPSRPRSRPLGDFTTEGLLNGGVGDAVYHLYNALPFQSAADGKRFGSQGALAAHLDKLYKVGQMIKKGEVEGGIGWYKDEDEWCSAAEEKKEDQGGEEEEKRKEAEELAKDKASRIDAEPNESRGTCMVCGQKFKAVYDDETGGFYFDDCREVVVEEETGFESGEVLCHKTCLAKLGVEDGDAVRRDQLLDI